ncbi:MAG: SpoIID/LytB domain-containing protein [Ilumatobacteraceae bacterium]
MLVRAMGFAAVAAAALVQCQPACEPAPAPPPPPVTSVVIAGQGNGHGRGMSAWGAYGLAVNASPQWKWEEILGYYYQGTEFRTVGNTPVRVRLMALDNSSVMGVVSLGGMATWNGANYGSVHAYESAPNRYDVYGTSDVGCPGDGSVGWALIGQSVPGPITVTTPLDQSSAPSGDVLGLCQPDNTVIHYRGSLTATQDGTGANRVVNEVLVENYLRGVVSREVSTSWGNAGGGGGMHALYAMATAARSFALSQHRYSYGDTCDTSTCQVYGGAAYRAGPRAPTSHPTVRVCESGNLTFECSNTNRAVTDTAGRVRTWSNGAIISAEYSATHGPYSAGGSFPVVDDSASNVPQNPYYQWTVDLDAATLAAHYGLGTLTAAATEHDPASNLHLNWGNRVVLTGTAGSVVVSAWDFRNTWGLPSPGFIVRGVA